MKEKQLSKHSAEDDEVHTMMVRTVNKFNNLKIYYEETKGICRSLSGTVKLYEEKCARLVKKKTALKIQFEVVERVIYSSEF